jgi:hypothetical protein
VGDRIGRFGHRVHQRLVEPVIALALRRRRLRLLGIEAAAIPERPVDWLQADACRAPCPLGKSAPPRLISRYVGRSRWRPTPMVVDLAALPDPGAVEALIKAGSSRNAAKIRKAKRAGFTVHPFWLPNHVEDVHAIKTSAAFRAAGPVLDRWFLKPGDIAEAATERWPIAPPTCPVHWGIWWGVFLPDPGRRQNGVTVDERLVAFVKLMRVGDLLHYTEIMGHADFLKQDVMLLLHHEILRWLAARDEAHAQGARTLLYGAAEHGGAGLLTWKKRAGFGPAWLRLA